MSILGADETVSFVTHEEMEQRLTRFRDELQPGIEETVERKMTTLAARFDQFLQITTENQEHIRDDIRELSGVVSVAASAVNRIESIAKDNATYVARRRMVEGWLAAGVAAIPFWRWLMAAFRWLFMLAGGIGLGIILFELLII